MADYTPTPILIVDDDRAVRAMLRDLFEDAGYVVHEAKNGSETLSTLKRVPIGLITMDLNLAGEDGFALSRNIRAAFDVPLIMISAKSDNVDCVVGLELGADDYIVKPFKVREVLARVRAVLRRYERGANHKEDGTADMIAFGSWRLNCATRELLDRSGQAVPLTGAEYDLLEAFARRPSRVLSRDALLDLVKGRAGTPFDRSIDTLVARLRKKIEPDVDNPVYIKTVRGAGYVFTPEPAASGRAER
jgi:two-component system phosphate regulon response regulator OmpR